LIWSGFINVKQFGAKGIGAAFDDSVPVQALLDYLVANLHSAHILFPFVSILAQTAYYNFATKLTIQGTFGQSIWLDGEYTSPVGVGGALLLYSGPTTAGAFIDLLGANDIKLSHFDVNANSLTKYGVWYRADQPDNIGASKVVLDNVNIRNPRNVRWTITTLGKKLNSKFKIPFRTPPPRT
jgi:hypothetical protein